MSFFNHIHIQGWHTSLQQSRHIFVSENIFIPGEFVSGKVASIISSGSLISSESLTNWKWYKYICNKLFVNFKYGCKNLGSAYMGVNQILPFLRPKLGGRIMCRWDYSRVYTLYSSKFKVWKAILCILILIITPQPHYYMIVYITNWFLNHKFGWGLAPTCQTVYTFCV